MKISNSKKELARIISENGGWRDGAEWAAMDKTDGNCNDNAVGFFSGELRPECFGKIKMWRCRHIETVFMGYEKSIFAKKIIGNWHQTVLSRAEYSHLYPSPDADGWIEHDGKHEPAVATSGLTLWCKWSDGLEQSHEANMVDWIDDSDVRIIAYRLHKPEQSKPEFCESVMRTIPEPEAKPPIEQLATDYRNAKDYAERKQQEADAAKADADEKLRVLELAGEAIGLLVSPITAKSDPELVVTDWRDLRVGGVIEVTGSSNEGWRIVEGKELTIKIVRSDGASTGEWLVRDNTEFRIIRRP